MRKTLTPRRARTILEYLERQESIYKHDNEAYRLHSGASFILRALSISRSDLQKAAQESSNAQPTV